MTGTHSRRGRGLELFKEVAQLLRLWHELRRAAHHGVHELWCVPHTSTWSIRATDPDLIFTLTLTRTLGAAPPYLYVINTLDGPDAKPSPYVDLQPGAALRLHLRGRAGNGKAVRSAHSRTSPDD